MFDIHENIRGQIKVKEWLPLRHLVAKCYGLVDWIASKMFYLILAENSYEPIYQKISKHYSIVLNLPDVNGLKEFVVEDRRAIDNGILYIGGVTEQRGIFEVVEALVILKDKKVPFHFHCVGPIADNLMAVLEEKEAFRKVKENITFYGLLPIYEAYSYSRKCKVGLSILHPIENYLKSYSTKIFEYMAIGLPFIVSDFELYNFVEKQNVGRSVDPVSVQMIAKTLEEMLTDADGSGVMGRNGLNVVNQEYTWESQERKLLEAYGELTS
ncbi:MAG: glycosyltransferase [Crocinitomicaceae bacterium]|nr:glycosyltransferase [Crocinitomicaceae bacterium]